ncbi:cupredoxin domain-containing protein [Chitinibacteraceae bacterium HSL-7]
MKPIHIVAGACALLASLAYAGGTHSGHHAVGYSFGEPGKSAQVSRTITVRALDTMRFEFDPALPSIKKGETIRFKVTNAGKIEHEFSIGDLNSQKAHAEMMREMPGMKHEADPSALTLAPGQSGELIWKFSKDVAGGIEFACQIPGHYDAGMKRSSQLSK